MRSSLIDLRLMFYPYHLVKSHNNVLDSNISLITFSHVINVLELQAFSNKCPCYGLYFYSIFMNSVHNLI